MPDDRQDDRPLPLLADGVLQVDDADQRRRLLSAYYDPLVIRPCPLPYGDRHYRLGTDALLVVTSDGEVEFMLPCGAPNGVSIRLC